jgi:hypothetical protein
VEEGVALPAMGTSVLGVGTSLNVFGAFRASGDWTAAGILVGSGGNAEGAIADLAAGSGTTADLEAGFEGTEMFKIPGRFSFAFVVFGVTCALLDEPVAGFLIAVAIEVALVGVEDFTAAGVVTALALLFSRAGKSSC